MVNKITLEAISSLIYAGNSNICSLTLTIIIKLLLFLHLHVHTKCLIVIKENCLTASLLKNLSEYPCHPSNDMGCTISTFSHNSSGSSTVPNTLTIMDKILTIIFHIFLGSRTSSRYFTEFSLTFRFTSTATTMGEQVLSLDTITDLSFLLDQYRQQYLDYL